MSNTKTAPDAADIDASISVLGEDTGEAQAASIESTAARDEVARDAGGIEQAGTGRENAQDTLEAPIRESEGGPRAADGSSADRSGGDPDRV